jgi:hypothetical protein
VWDYILEIKENRIIMLTTHSMEEADALCTRIGIMVNGELKSLGTPQELKHMVRTYSAAVSGHTTPLVPPPPRCSFCFFAISLCSVHLLTAFAQSPIDPFNALHLPHICSIRFTNSHLTNSQ